MPGFAPVVVDDGTAIAVPAQPAVPAPPRNFAPRPQDRYITFVVELHHARDVDIDATKLAINQVLCTKLSGYFPELLFLRPDAFEVQREWARTRRLGRPLYHDAAEVKRSFTGLRHRTFPPLPFDFRRLFPGSETDFKGATRFGLDKFFKLTLPIFERQFERRATGAKLEARLFEVAYELRNLANVREASPSTRFKRYQLLSSMGTTPNTLPTNWMLDSMRADRRPARIDGSGVLIGHPDSGWTPHSRLGFTMAVPRRSPSFDTANDYCVFDNRDTAEEPLASSAIHRFHGTSTAGCIVANGGGARGELTGIAPGARMLSIRTINDQNLYPDVALICDSDVAEAVWYAMQKNVDIISMSLGGYPMPALECVVAHAVYNNVIVVAAAGQYYPFAVFPALYPECIAAGASNQADAPWAFCVKHSKIAISAPGELVWSAYWDDAQPTRGEIVDGKGNGCSFATAYIAGAAALWLQRFQRTRLISELGGRATLQELYLAHLQASARVPSGWKTDESGAGILDVERLLDRSFLPDPATFRGQDWNTWRRRSAMELCYLVFEHTDPAVVRARIENLFNVPSADAFMNQFGIEVMHLVMGIGNVATLLGRAMDETAQDVETTLEDIVDAVKDAASEALDVIASWA